MGQIMGVQKGSGGTNRIFIDFEEASARPTQEIQELHTSAGSILQKCPHMLDRLLRYAGCWEVIRNATTHPGPETEEAAWQAVLPFVDQLQQFYEFSQELDACIPRLLEDLCNNNPVDQLVDHQAITKLVADVFDFVLRFDHAKMLTPAIQNDFSYYRRTLNRKAQKKDTNIKVRDEVANRISLFLAYPTPMMNMLEETTSKHIRASPDPKRQQEKVVCMLATLANACCYLVENGKFKQEELNLLSLRAMVGSILLYDHTSEQSAFAKKSPINIKGCVSVLKSYPHHHTDDLMNMLRFNSRLKEADTPKAIKQMFE